MARDNHFSIYDFQNLQIPHWIFEKKATCPASELTHLDACYPASRCRIEKRLISAKLDPSSFHNYCTGNYRECPTWRMKRDQEFKEKGIKHY